MSRHNKAKKIHEQKVIMFPNLWVGKIVVNLVKKQKYVNGTWCEQYI